MSHEVAHHFDDWPQQRTACLLGMWVFLASEVLFFGGAITTYLVYRRLNPIAFAHASQELDVVLGTVNTLVLLTSSFTMVLAVHFANVRHSRNVALSLLATIVLGTLFLAIKFSEYLHKYHEGHAPLLGLPFHYEGESPGAARLFFGLYFGMTGLHALHMVIGIGILLAAMIPAFRGRYNGGRDLEMEVIGLYWHFVDVVWIFLFPLLYLVDRSV